MSHKFILLSTLGQPKSLRDELVERGMQCPECGSQRTEDNSFTEYRCVDCDHRWGFDCGERYGY